MNFVEAVTSVYSKYVQFSGRARRSEYWWWFLFQVIAGLVLAALEASMGSAQSFGGGPISLIWSLINLLPGISVGVRRLHDLDKSGWWLLIALVPLVGAILLIVWFASEGTRQGNQYGDDPLAA